MIRGSVAIHPPWYEERHRRITLTFYGFSTLDKEVMQAAPLKLNLNDALQRLLRKHEKVNVIKSKQISCINYRGKDA